MGSARPGAKALLAWCLEAYDEARNLGIYNCRDVAGSASLSAHGEGRAGDTGMPMASDGGGSALGHQLVERLAAAGSRLGLTAIIYDRTIWSAVSPSGRPYTGVHPHYDHVHWEITRAAAEKLTLATCRAVLSQAPGFPLPPGHWYGIPSPNPRNHSGYYWASDRAGIATWQRQMAKRGWSIGAADGRFGPRSRAVAVAFQREKHLKVDGFVGVVTWRTAWTAPVT